MAPVEKRSISFPLYQPRDFGQNPLAADVVIGKLDIGEPNPSRLALFFNDTFHAVCYLQGFVPFNRAHPVVTLAAMQCLLPGNIQFLEQIRADGLATQKGGKKIQ